MRTLTSAVRIAASLSPWSSVPAAELHSFHSGGVVAVFGDGSVHFIRSSIFLNDLSRLIAQAGGEVLTGNEY